MANILISEDEADLAKLWWGVLEAAGHTVMLTYSGIDAISALALRKYDLVITDVNMPDGGGVLVANEARATNNAIPIIMISGDPAFVESDEYTRSRDFGPCEFLTKPVDLDRLTGAVAAALAQTLC